MKKFKIFVAQKNSSIKWRNQHFKEVEDLDDAFSTTEYPYNSLILFEDENLNREESREKANVYTKLTATEWFRKK